MVQTSATDKLIKAIIHLILITFAILCILPMVVTISISFSNEQDLVLNGYSILPRVWDDAAYAYILRSPRMLLDAYWVTVRVTLLGTVAGTFLMAMAAFPLARPDFAWRKPINFYIFFTMLFNGGLVPTYIWITKYLHLKNTLWVLVVPILVVPWYVFLLLTYFKGIPLEMVESAKMDGANEFTIFLRIILPMSKPAIATVALLQSLRYWNEWFLGLLYISEPHLIPLQLWMQRVMANMQFLLLNMDRMGVANIEQLVKDLPTESVRMAMAVLAAGPMMFVFPFFQKYFTKGMTVGSLKG
jgi:putative aldouronate transport system permease protein